MIKRFKAWRERRKKFRHYETFMPQTLDDLRQVSNPFTSAGLCVICNGLGGHAKDCVWKFANRPRKWHLP